MSVDAQAIAPLLQEWRMLSVGDRKGILRRLPSEQRLLLQRLAAPAEEAEAPQDQLYRGYSTWLGELLEACENGTAKATHIKPAARRALLDAHEQAAGLVEKTGKPSLAEHARSLLQSWKDRL